MTYRSDSPMAPPPVANVPPTVIVTPTRRLREQLLSALHLADTHLPSRLTARSPLADALPWSSSGSIGIVGPIIGGAAAVLACEPLLASGARRVLFFGAAAGLFPARSGLHIGDIFFPSVLLSAQQTVLRYGGDEDMPLAYSALQQRLVSATRDRGSCSVQTGGVYSSDVPVAENEEQLTQWYERGARAMDMEAATLAQLCRCYNAEFAAALVISDLLLPGWKRGFSSAEFKSALSAIAEVMVELVRGKD